MAGPCLDQFWQRRLLLPGEGGRGISAFCRYHLTQAVTFLISTFKKVLSENTLRKCLCKQVLLSCNPAVLSKIAQLRGLS